MRPLVSRHHGLLGTVIELHVWAPTATVAAATEGAAIREMERLEDVFNVHDAGSNFRRWQRGVDAASEELDVVLGLAETWRERSGGAFDPTVGALVELWDEAARRGRPPTGDEIADTRLAMRDPDDPRSRPSYLN